MSVEPYEITAGPLRLSLVWDRDRYRHAIHLADESAAASPRFVPLVESREGEPDELWPPSPVLQELHVESRPDGKRVALLVGRAGRSHWSLSVLADPVRRELLFEAACRCGARPTWLGSSYVSRCVAASAERGTDRQPLPPSVWLVAASSDRRWLLTPTAAPANTAAPAPADDAIFDAGPCLTVNANWTAAGDARTLQWGYRVAMEESTEH